MSKIIKPFYINRKRYIETEGRAKIGVEGHYTIRAIKPGRGVVREISFPNLLTNLGMDALGSSPTFIRMHLGTGTAAPDVTDTQLAAFGVNVVNGMPSVSAGTSGSSPHFGFCRLVWTSSVGGATGTWTEIGVSNQNTTGGLRSRALILDGGGNPTSFPVLSDEQFSGVYEFRVFAPASDAKENIALSGTSYDTTTRALDVTGNAWHPPIADGLPIFQIGSAGGDARCWTGGLGSVTDVIPQGSNLGNRSGVVTDAYGAGNHYFDSGARWGSAAGVGQVRTVSLKLRGGGAFQIEYSPTFTKLTTEEFIHNQRVSWARK